MSQAAPAIVHTAREQWLARRRELVTASDVAAILGVDPRRGPMAVYAEKVSGGVSEEERRWMVFGRRVEGAIADWYADETGRRVADLGAHEIQIHPHIPWFGATLDRETTTSEAAPAPAVPGRAFGPLEAKAVAGFKALEWREDPPLHYVVQVQAQMAVTEASWGSLAALIGGVALAWKDLLRNDDFLAAAMPKLEEFRLRVQRREPPEADGLPGTGSAIRRLWAEADGTTVALDRDAFELARAWEARKLNARTQDELADELENKLRARLGSATFGALPDGSFLSLKKQERSGYEVGPKSFRVLRRWWPRLKRGSN